MRFSQKYGYSPVKDAIQLDSMDGDLRNSLWSVLSNLVWTRVRSESYSGRAYLSGNPDHRDLCRGLWFSYFKLPVDKLPDDWSKVFAHLRTYFFQCEWHAVYDFLEFVLQHYGGSQFKDRFVASCNFVLEREVAGYRFVNGSIAPITQQAELDEVAAALENARGPVQAHLQRALELLADRKNPDYRNSIKESISAVESLVARTVGEKGTLGQLIKRLEQEIELHPGLAKAFGNMYGYTSDEGGIRHAMLETEKVTFDDAKFFLVVCSSFVNFVTAKLKA